MRRFLAALCLGGLLISAMTWRLTGALADNTAALPYDAVASKLAAFEAIPEDERDRLNLVTRIVSSRAPARPISLFMAIGTQRFVIPRAADGSFVLPARPAGAATIETDQPAGSLELQIVAAPRLRDPMHFSAVELEGAAMQATHLLESVHGVGGWSEGKITRVAFACDKARGCALRLTSSVGDRIFLPDARGIITLDLARTPQDAWMSTTTPFSSITMPAP
jgi:hypothetical protein